MRNARTRRRLSVTLTVCAFAFLAWPLAWKVNGQTLAVRTIPVGIAPIGVASVQSASSRNYAVTNSGDNSVSILSLIDDYGTRIAGLHPVAVARGVPAPYAVAGCSERIVVTSPEDNSVSIIRVPEATIAVTIKVGSKPKAVACAFADVRSALVSNSGDNTLTVIDVNAGTVIGTIPGVPGARGVHGIEWFNTQQGITLVWVAGADANMLTQVNLNTRQVVRQFPFRSPTTVRLVYNSLGTAALGVASEADGTFAFLNPETGSALGDPVVRNIGKPGDVVSTELGYFAVQGSDGSLQRSTAVGANSAVSGVTGVSSLAADRLERSAVVLATGTSSNSLYLITLQPEAPAQFSMANGASFSNASIAPGSWASVFALTGVFQALSAPLLPLPPSLAGVSLSVNGTYQLSINGTWSYSTTGATAASLQYAGPQQVNFQFPPGIPAGASVPVQLTKADGSTLLTTVSVTATAPGIFTTRQTGQGQGAVLNQDSSVNGDPAVSAGAKFAARGSVIQIYATGAGATTPSLSPGFPAPASGSLVLTVAQPTVTIGGKTAVVQFSGLAPGFVALWQINAVVPADVTPGSDVPLSVSAGGQTSNTVTIAVQ